MSNDQKDKNEDWVFELDEAKKLQADQKTNEVEKKSRPAREKKLIAEKPKIDKSRSRSSLYEDLENSKKKKIEDFIVIAPLAIRLIAFFIDLFLYVAMIILSFKLLSFDYQFTDNLMLKYSYKWDISDQIVGVIFFILNFFVMHFFLFIYTMLFYNASVGKLLTGLRVRSDKNYSLNIVQVFLRETIFRPFSVISIFGIFILFFNKKRKTLHDVLSNTLVIKD